MSAVKYPLTIEQSTTFERSILWRDEADSPKDLTGWTARMSIRPSYNGSEVTQLKSGDGTIVLTHGKITLKLSPERTAALPVDLSSKSVPPVQTYYYDLLLTSPEGVVKRLVFGPVTVIGAITRAVQP